MVVEKTLERGRTAGGGEKQQVGIFTSRKSEEADSLNIWLCPATKGLQHLRKSDRTEVQVVVHSRIY